MKNYDPEVVPEAMEWLALDEQQRIDLAEDWHRAARIKLPNSTLHAVFHAIVENQIAEGLEPVVDAMARLVKDGLSRHEALHAIGSVASEYIFETLNTPGSADSSTAQARYNAAVDQLTASNWRRQSGV